MELGNKFELNDGEAELSKCKKTFCNLTCKLCKRDFSEMVMAFRDPAELKHIHTTAHLQDLVRDMHKVCACAAKNGWVGREEVSLSEDILLRSEIIDGGLF